ncbi:NFATC2-interacting protein [Trichoplax sp. H2]|nr:NFATC2-interacting protein [Trichoplax sp. H2]|eukprot:RDD38096.1 NFATC2-interacting protein [Trichoplax sp. H2]
MNSGTLPSQSMDKSVKSSDEDTSEEDEISFFTYRNSQPINFVETQTRKVIIDDDDDDDIISFEPANKRQKKGNTRSKSTELDDSEIISNEDYLICTSTVDTDALRRQVEKELESDEIIMKANSMMAEVLRRKIDEHEDTHSQNPDEDLDEHPISGTQTNKFVRIPIRIGDKIKRYKLLETEPFQVIAETIAREEMIGVDQVLISRKDLDIKLDDTPQSINFSVTDILDFFVIKKPTRTEKCQTDSILTIKIQSDDKSRATKTFKVHKLKPLETAFKEYAKFHRIPLSSIAFSIDGERIDLKRTPVSLELESGDIIDARIIADTT